MDEMMETESRDEQSVLDQEAKKQKKNKPKPLERTDQNEILYRLKYVAQHNDPTTDIAIHNSIVEAIRACSFLFESQLSMSELVNNILLEKIIELRADLEPHVKKMFKRNVFAQIPKREEKI